MSTATLCPPAARIIAPAGLPRDEWLEVRRQGIGGSDVAAICGLDPYHRSPFHVYLDKLGEAGDDTAGEAAMWGNLLEDAVARHFGTSSGMTVIESPGTLASLDRPWQLLNVDRLLAHPTDTSPSEVLEVKTRSGWVADQWPDDGMPDGPALQVQHALDVTGYDVAHVAVLLGGQRYKQYRVARDQELIEHLRQIEGDFWRRVETRQPPPVDASRACTDLLAHLYDVKADSVVELDPAVVGPLIAERAAGKQAVKDAEARVALAENTLKGLLGENEVGAVNGQPVITWKQHHRAGFTVEPSTYRKLHIPRGTTS